MKKTFLSSLLTVMTLFVTSCDPAANLISNTSQVAASGTWRVTLFTDSGNDETAGFAGYVFTFSSGGMVTAVKDGVPQNGAWGVSSSSGQFNIDLGQKGGSNQPLGELTDDWKIISNSTTEIKLQDDNTAGNEFVTYTKN